MKVQLYNYGSNASIFTDCVHFSEEKAKMEERQRKRNMLDAVEEAQQRIKRKAISSNKDEKQTWAESLITAIIKNLEVRQKMMINYFLSMYLRIEIYFFLNYFIGKLILSAHGEIIRYDRSKIKSVKNFLSLRYIFGTYPIVPKNGIY